MNKKIIEAVKKTTCSLVKGGAEIEIPTNSNSIVRYSKWNIQQEVIEAAIPVFNEVYTKNSSITEAYPHLKNKKFEVKDLFQFGSNFVQVFGEASEELHIHATTVVVHVIQGKGTLLYHDKNANEQQLEAEEGDTVIIPAGAPHFFHGDPLIVYTGIEFGPILDYQKHHYYERLAP